MSKIKDKDDLKVDELIAKHLDYLNDTDPVMLARFKSDFIVALLDARIEERVRVTGEHWTYAEQNIVAELRKPEEDKSDDDNKTSEG